MSQTTRTIAGVLFLFLSIAAISFIRINPTSSTPTRSTESRTAGIMEGVVQGIIITQELTSIKDYWSAVELVFTHSGRSNSNENTILLLDAGYKTLFKESFSSGNVKDGALTTFRFDKSIFIGKGNKVLLCLFSNDGTPTNAISPLLNQTDSLGPLHISKVNGSDLVNSVKNKVRRYRGSLMLRTYETDSSQFWLMKGFLYFIGLVIATVIIFFAQIRSLLARTRIVPEWIFLFIALPAATIFAFITPPLQVPDEGSHFSRAYEIAEFNFFNKDQTGPASMTRLDSAFGHLHFLAGEKTSLADIKKHIGVKLEPALRVPISPPAYTLPYLPQALGIFIGRVTDSSPLALMYLGRIFNLLISILIMFFAIRIIPQFKWIFLLLALMPKTLFLFGSLSYDSLTISLSFFTTAVFFYYAFACERNIRIKDLAVMAFLVLLLLFCKPPYFILALLFFFIPPKKFGYLYKYILISIGVVVILLVVLKGGPIALNYFSGPDAAQQVNAATPADSTIKLPVIRPDDQIKLIKSDIPAYFKLILRSGFDYYRAYILKSFVGVLGWIDVELPDLLTYTYLLLILFSALALSGDNVKLGLTKKTLLLILLAITFVIVETAMYVYATRPGRDRVFGVQGRYFIPMAPLFFMLFYNRYLNPMLNLLFSMRRAEYNKAKPKVKPVIYQEILVKEQLFDKSLYLLLTCFTLFTLLYSIYMTLIRYYNI
ncbi:MAG: DUF2142 domain-containing protein [Bacteroidetes bacterium]|nr:DUF2142 domain-containing protein [Bacteroidota bacterium]